MSPSELSPLLAGDLRRPPSFQQKIRALLRAEDEPSWLASYRWFIFGSWANLLLLLVPVAAAAHYLNWNAPLRFGFSFVAIIPLAKLLGDATEQMSLFLGQTLAGLLNATFGNAVEIIVGLVALFKGEVRIVQTSMLGSILCNILLVLGCSFLAGGFFKHEHESVFSVTVAQTSASLMTLACITLVIPAAYHARRPPKHTIPPVKGVAAMSGVLYPDLDDSGQRGLLVISRGTAILLLGVYVAYLMFQLKTHASLFNPQRKPREGGASAVEPGQEEEEKEAPRMSMVAAGLGLLVVTIATSLVADYLVESIEETANKLGIPKTFIGLVLLPIVSNAGELISSVCVAMKDKMELTIGICVGSSIQIATFVLPLLVVIGWCSGHDLTLFFEDFETVTFFVSVFLINLLLQDGKSNYMEGLMLITLYFVIAMAFWVS